MDVGTSLGRGAPGHSAHTTPIADLTIYSLPVLNLDSRRLDVSSEDREIAVDIPPAGWPPCARLYNLDVQPRPSPHAALRTGPLATMDSDTRYDREWGKDIASLALAAADAVKVDQFAWWMMGGGRRDRHFFWRAWTLRFLEMKRRNARRHPNVHCQWGVRLVPNANGALSQKFQGPQLMQPAAREVSPRGLLSLLQNPDQVGFPGTLNTDASLASALRPTRHERFSTGPAGRRRLTLFAFRALWRRAATPPNTP